MSSASRYDLTLICFFLFHFAGRVLCNKLPCTLDKCHQLCVSLLGHLNATEDCVSIPDLVTCCCSYHKPFVEPLK